MSVSESEMSLSDSEPEDVAPTPPQKQTKPLQHPHFGGKQPKKHIRARCINVACKEEKEEKDEKIKKLTEKKYRTSKTKFVSMKYFTLSHN